MIISLLVAVDERGGIGLKGRLPWKLSTDLKRFKELTMGHTLIMGRKTYESIGRLLPGRTMIVLTRSQAFPSHFPEGIICASSLIEAFAAAESHGETEAFVIGGGEIYSQTLPLANRIYLTRVHAVVPADTYFPKLDEKEWILKEGHHYEASEKDQYPFSMMVLERKTASQSSVV